MQPIEMHFSTTTTITGEATSTEWLTETSTSTVMETAVAGISKKRDVGSSYERLKRARRQKVPYQVDC